MNGQLDSLALPSEGLSLKEYLADLEVSMINQALDAQDCVVARAADMLGMRRTTLVRENEKNTSFIGNEFYRERQF